MTLEPFKEQGYQIIHGLIDQRTVNAIHDFLECSVDEALALLGESGLPVDESNFAEKLGSINKTELSQQVHSVLVGHFPLEIRLSEKLWPAACQDNVKTLIREALGSEKVFMHMPPTARYVLPGNARAGVPPHQDVSYNRHMADFLVMWMPLVSISKDCGGVVVYEGSNEQIERSRTGDESDWLGGIDTSEFDEVACSPMEPGDVLLLNRWIVHGSAPNRSDKTRISVDYRFFGEPAQSNKHYLDLQTLDVVAPKAA